MLKAVIHGKAGRVDIDGKEERTSWRKLFKSHEDLLTAAVFTRWSYLSNKTQNHLMCQWFDVSEDGDHDFSAFQNIHFWPKYDLTEIEGRQFVEPDVLIQFKAFNLLIEVKPPLGGDQYLEQWQHEIAGYFAWEENECKPLYFLAVGRIDKVPDEWFEAIMHSEGDQNPQMLHALKWKPVAESVFNLLEEEGLLPQDRRILTDMLSALELYSIRGHDYLWSDFETCKQKLSVINLDILSGFGMSEAINDDNDESTTYIHTFDEIACVYNTINMEMMKQWQI